MAMDLDSANESDCNYNNNNVDDDNDIDIDIDIVKQTTLFSKLRITKNKNRHNKKVNKIKKKQSIAECRVENDLNEINNSSYKSFAVTTTIEPNKSNLLNFDFTIKPIEGAYRNGVFKFKVFLCKNYPYSSPKILCENDIFHPNINPETKQIGLKILNNWRPVLSLNDIIIAIQSLFFKPCESLSVILNKFAADLYIKNKQEFDYTVQKIINGCNYNKREWQCCSRDKYLITNNNNNNMNIYMKNNSNNNNNNCFNNQVIPITKKSSVLGYRKRNFKEMSMENISNNNNYNINCKHKFIDDETILFNPFGIKKKQKIKHANNNTNNINNNACNNFSNNMNNNL
eukprot:190225_1